jgi:hypothetical protein
VKERDPLDGLRAAWRALEPPPARDAGPDPALAWTRAAWDALAPPAPRRRAAHGPRRIARLLVGAAAAALATGVLGWSLRAPRSSEPRPGALAALERRDRAGGLQPTFHDDGSIELRSGVVRLVLIPERDGSVPQPMENER